MRDYEDVRFVYVSLPGFRTSADLIMRRPPFRIASIPQRLLKMLLRRPAASLIIEDKARMVRTETGTLAPYDFVSPKAPVDLLEWYLNGPRTLSNERLSYLVVSRTPAPDGELPTPPATPLNSVDPPDGLTEEVADSDRVVDFELFICAAHFIGDGMALHQFANDFFGLLGSASSAEDIERLVAGEWKLRWGHPPSIDVMLIQPCYHVTWLTMDIDTGPSCKRRREPRTGKKSIPSRSWTDRLPEFLGQADCELSRTGRNCFFLITPSGRAILSAEN